MSYRGPLKCKCKPSILGIYLSKAKSYGASNMEPGNKSGKLVTAKYDIRRGQTGLGDDPAAGPRGGG